MRVLAWEREGEEYTNVKKKKEKKRFGYHYELLSLKIDTCPHKVFWWHEKKVLRNSHLFFPLLPTVHNSLSSPNNPESLFHFFLPTQASHWQSGLSKPPLETSTQLIIYQTSPDAKKLWHCPHQESNPHLPSWTHLLGKWRDKVFTSLYLEQQFWDTVQISLSGKD